MNTTMLAAGPIAPISHHQLLILLLEIGLLLLTAILLARLAKRLGMPAIVGELFAGVLWGPSILGHFAPGFSGWIFPADASQLHLLDAVGQLGLLLLVALTGMEMDLGLVRRRGAAAAKISAAGFVIPFGLGVAIAFVIPAAMLASGSDRLTFAMFLGVAMSVSAIPVIAKTLFDMKLQHRNVGQMILTAGMIDDIVGWFMLSVVSAMAVTALSLGSVALSVAVVVGIAVFTVTVGRPAMRLALRVGGTGHHTACVAAIVVLCAAATHALKLEAVFGAFVCGILVRWCGGIDETSLTQLRSVVLGVLAPLFFVTAGLRMDLTALAKPMVLLVALAVLFIAILGKFVGALVGALTSGLNRWEALAVGAGMNARGVVEVVVAMVGLRLGVLTKDTYTIVVLVAIVTSVMAPPILRMAMRRVEETAEERLRLGQPAAGAVQ